LKAVNHRHSHIQEQEIGLGRSYFLQGLSPVSRFINVMSGIEQDVYQDCLSFRSSSATKTFAILKALNYGLIGYPAALHWIKKNPVPQVLVLD